MAAIALSMNVRRRAVTQFCSYDFNSGCQLGAVFLACDESGIFTLVGSDDAGTDIDAHFQLPDSDWGIENSKRIRSLFFGMETDGSLDVTVTDNEDNENTTRMEYVTYSRQGSNKCNPGRNQNQGRYLAVKVANVDGCWFAIDSIDVLPVILNRKPR